MHTYLPTYIHTLSYMYVYDILKHVVLYYIYDICAHIYDTHLQTQVLLLVCRFTRHLTFSCGPQRGSQRPARIQVLPFLWIRWVYRIIPLRTKLLGGQQTIYIYTVWPNIIGPSFPKVNCEFVLSFNQFQTFFTDVLNV